MASASVSMGILRCFETTSESPVRIGAARDAAVPSSRTMDAGPSMRRDLSFSVQRLESLDRGGELAENIVVFQPEDFREQSRITESMEVMLSKTPALLIVDSVTGLYRADIEKPGTVFVQNRELNRQLAYLSDLASRFELTILLTGQVHSRPSGGSWLIAPVATRTLRHWSYLILRLRPTPRRDVRECLLEKIDGRDVRSARALFRIGEIGLEDV